jgi:hypothetical protein
MEAVLLKRLLAGLLGAWQALSAVRLGYVTAAIASACCSHPQLPGSLSGYWFFVHVVYLK